MLKSVLRDRKDLKILKNLILISNFMWTFELIKNWHFGNINFSKGATLSFFANEAIDLHENYLIPCCFILLKKVPRNRATAVLKWKFIRSESKRNKRFTTAVINCKNFTFKTAK